MSATAAGDSKEEGLVISEKAAQAVAQSVVAQVVGCMCKAVMATASRASAKAGGEADLLRAFTITRRQLL